MHRQFSINSIQDKELGRTRHILLLGSLFYVIWGFFVQQFLTDYQDPIFTRIVFSAVSFSFYMFTFLRIYSYGLQDFVLFCPFILMTSHSFYISYQNNYAVPFLLGNYILAVGVLSSLTRAHFIILYAAFFIAATLPNLFMPTAAFPGSISLTSSCILAAVCVYTAVSRRTIYEDLLDLTQQQSAMLNNMTDGVMIVSNDLTIHSVNPAGKQIFGVDTKSMLHVNRRKVPWRSYTTEGVLLKETDHPIFKAFAEMKTIENAEVKIGNENDLRSLIITVVPLFEHQKQKTKKVLVTFRDVTQLKRNEDLMNQQRAILESASRLTSLGEMAAGVAHEINNPLAIIDGRAHQLQRQLKTGNIDQNMFTTYLTNIRDTVKRVAKIIKSMKDLAKGGSNEPFETKPINQIIEETLDLCREKLIRSGTKFSVSLSPDLLVKCRSHEISQIVLNLIHNAFDAIVELPERWIKIESMAEDDFIYIKISDSGHGIPPGIAKKIMMPFFSTKEIGKGTGLGLSISKSLAGVHGGDLYLDEKAVNTTFILKLPKAAQTQKVAS